MISIDDYKLLGNGECDLQCNTTNCNYDQYDCIMTTDNHICNETYYVHQHDCDPSWIGDNWCDANCQYNSLCHYDADDCNQQSCSDDSKQCYAAYDRFTYISNSITNDNQVNIEELCDFYPILIQLGIYLEGMMDDNNCTVVFNMSDADNNNEISFKEGLIAMHDTLDISKEKAEQLNCSRYTGIDAYH